ncbi:MAG TPA: hypothetical protein VMZ90_13985 [Vicinamibacterales bacterium]|nr:hypothetical protein [Vicinamibacterales bacterium]
MDNEPDSPLDEAARLRDEPVPSQLLESRVVAAMRANGLVRTRSAWSWNGIAAKTAASLLIFVTGAIAGHYVSFAPGATQSQPRYLLLLAGDVPPASDGSTRATEYGEWARGLAARGIKVSGDELTSHAELVTNARAATFPDLASVGGYFMIEAADDGAAAAVAYTCPHIKYGGSIVVRRMR